jgi:hypothetical protein
MLHFIGKMGNHVVAVINHFKYCNLQLYVLCCDL